MRALKLLSDLLKWRWTPCVALVASSLLYVLIALFVVPDTLGMPSATRSVNVVNAVDQPNALGAPRATPPARPGFTAPRTVDRPTPPVVSPPPPAPPPPAPPVDERAPEPPPPAAPPAPEPPPQPAVPEQADEEGAEEGRAPAPRGSRFAASQLRVLPAIAAQVTAAASASPEAPDTDGEE